MTDEYLLRDANQEAKETTRLVTRHGNQDHQQDQQKVLETLEDENR